MHQLTPSFEQFDRLGLDPWLQQPLDAIGEFGAEIGCRGSLRQGLQAAPLIEEF